MQGLNSLFGWLTFQTFSKEKNGEDCFANFPDEALANIFSHLGEPSDLKNVRLGCKKWSRVVSKKDVKKATEDAILAEAFGAKQWEELGVNVEDVPLPHNIDKILDSHCPIWEQKLGNEKNEDDFAVKVPKKVKDTHILILMPCGLTLKRLGDLAEEYFPDISTYIEKSDDIETEVPIKKSYWLLIAKDVLPGSKQKSNILLDDFVFDFAKKAQIDYKIPRALEVAVCIFSKYPRFETRPFNELFTRCKNYGRYPKKLTVGCYRKTGFYVFNDRHDSDLGNTGIGAVRRFNK